MQIGYTLQLRYLLIKSQIIAAQAKKLKNFLSTVYIYNIY